MKKAGSSLVSSFIVLTLLGGFVLYSAIVSAQVFEPPKCAPPQCQPTSIQGGLSDVLGKSADARGFAGTVTIGGEAGTENVKVGIGVINPSSELHILRGGFATSARTNDLAHFGFGSSIDGNRQLMIQQWGNANTAKQFIMGNGYISDAGPSIVNGPFTRAAGLMWDDDSLDVVINSQAGFNKAGSIVPAVTIKSDTGNVGIGTNNPTHTKLEIHGTGPQGLTIKSTNRWNYLINDDKDFIIASDVGTTGHKAKFSLGAPDNSFILDANGNVGIGTSDPKTKLDVNGSFRLNRPSALVDAGNTLGGNIQFVPDNFAAGATNGYLLLNYPDGNTVRFGTDFDGNLSGGHRRNIQFGRNDAPYLTIEDGGNVGIGAVPQSKLYVEKNVAGTVSVGVHNPNSAGISALSLSAGSTFEDRGAQLQFLTASNELKLINTGDPGSSITFHTRSGASSGERMKIDQNGNVGIGTIDPTQGKLVVAGNISVDNAAMGYGGSGSSGYGIAFPATSNDAQYVYGEHDGGDTSNLIFHQRDNGSDGVIFRNTDWDSKKIPQTLDYMKISRDKLYYVGGNVGIGTTDSKFKLDIGTTLGSEPGFDQLAVKNIELFTPFNPGPGDGIITLHHGGRVAHQLRYNNSTLYLERSSRPFYGSNDTPNLNVAGTIKASDFCLGTSCMSQILPSVSASASISGSAQTTFIRLASVPSSGKHYGRLLIDWESVLSPSCCHHGQMEVSFGKTWTYSFPQENVLDLHQVNSHNSFHPYKFRTVKEGDNIYLEVSWNRDWSSGSFKTTKLSQQGSVSLLSPVVSGYSGATEKELVIDDQSIDKAYTGGMKIDNKLVVGGNITLSGGSKEIQFKNASGAIEQYVWHTGTSLGLGAGSESNSMFITNTGNVGIGTVPSSRLHIHGNYSNNGAGGFLLDATDNADPNTYALRINPFVVGSAKVGYQFQTKSVIGGTQVPLTFDNAGNVGIGTPSPGAKLDIIKETSTNDTALLVRNKNGNHSWGIVGEFRVDNLYDRPSILFSTALNTTTWSVGYGSNQDDNFRIRQNHGYRNNSWGTERFKIDTSGVVSAGQFGIYPGYLDNQINAGWTTLEQPGVQGLRVWDNFSVSDNVGIGTASADSGMKLDVRGNVRIGDGSTAEQDILFKNNIGPWEVGTNNVGNGTSNNQFYIYDNAYRLTVQRGTGNVGIGTTSPGAKLSFANLADGRDTADGITWYNPAPLVYGIYRTAGAWSGPNYQQLKLSWDTGIVIDGGTAYGKSGTVLQPNGGNVGIGTRQPQYTLHLSGDAGGVWTGVQMTEGVVNSYVTNTGTRLGFYAGDGSTEDVTILNDGSVGIGKADPKAKLDVAGGSIFRNGKIVAGNGTNNGNNSGIWFWDENDSNHVIYSANSASGISPGAANGGSAPDNKIGPSNEHRLRFRTATGQGWLFENNNNLGVIDFDSDDGSAYFGGNVGIKRVPNAGYDLDVNGTIRANGISLVGGICLSNGCKSSWPAATTGVNTSIDSPVSGPLYVRGSGGGGQIRVAPSTTGEEASIGFYKTNNYDSSNRHWVMGIGSWGVEKGFDVAMSREGLSAPLMVWDDDGGGSVGIGKSPDHNRFKLDVAGSMNLTAYSGSNVALTQKDKLAFATDRIGLDIAELFEAEEQVEVGDVVVVAEKERKIKKSTQAYQKEVIGIVSGSPAILFEGQNVIAGSEPNRFRKGIKPPIALAGRIPVKVSLENGPIKPGDYLTTSSVHGIAMRATQPGTTIGIALEHYNGGEKNKILTFISIGEKNMASIVMDLQKRVEDLEKNGK